MKRFIIGFGLVLASSLSVYAQESLADKYGQRLAEVLQPGASSGGSSVTRPVPLATPPVLAEPWVVPPAYPGLPPQPGIESGKPIRPRLSQEAAPLVHYRARPEGPQEIHFGTTELVVIPTLRDVDRPIAVPILNQATADRASLADATLDASIAAALSQPVPSRSQPVPFVPLNLPDPFELREAAKLRNVPAENATPAATPPRILLLPTAPPKK